MGETGLFFGKSGNEESLPELEGLSA
jgi:hypothetical protein